MQRTATQLPLFEDSALRHPSAAPDGIPGVRVRESARARRLSIKVFPRGRVEVVVPKRTRAAEVAAFVRENREWIDQARESFAEQFSPEFYRLPMRIDLKAIDRQIAVVYRPQSEASTVKHRLTGDTLALSGAVHDEDQCVKALKRWLSGVAKHELAPRLRELSRELGLDYKRVQIRAQRTCWGSHSSSGTISLNLCLLFLEPPIVRYLMVHELCHGRHMDHSRRFWNLVGQFEPRYRRLDRALGESWRSVPGWLGIY